MARLQKCTDKDISMILETDSESDTRKLDETYTPTKSTNNSDSSDSEKLFESNKNLLLRTNALRKEHASLRLKLRRSSEQSAYKIDSDSDNERPKRTTRSAKLKSLQNDNRTPRKGGRIIKIPKRYSDYICSTKSEKSVLHREEINYNEKKLFLTSVDTVNEKKEKTNKSTITIDNSSDSDCVCVNFIPKTTPRSITKLKNNKRSHVSSIENIYDNVTAKVTTHKSLKRICTNEKSQIDDIDDISLDKRKTLKTRINSKADMIEHTPTDSTPRRKPRSERNSYRNILAVSNEYESTTQKDENKRKVDIEDICNVAKNLSIETKQKNKDIKNVTELSIIQNGLNTPKSHSGSLRHSALTPSMKMRTKALVKPVTPLQEARTRLHVSAVPKSLPCREEEFNNVYSFLESKLMDNSGGCIYISGVPGTGKTATVNEIVNCLKRSVQKNKLDHFDFIEINGMKLSEPKQAYVQILKQLSGKVLTWEQAYNALEKRFNTNVKNRPMTLLLVDELDLLCTKRQDVIYSLLDWPTKATAQLIVVTIANTMDLPERVLMGKVTSRLGLTRVTFQPYNHKQLQEIVLTRLKDTNVFKSEAIQLIARKISAVSGDARRALDICRRAAEITETRNGATVTIQDVNDALSEMIANPKVQAIRHCSILEQIFLQAVCAEVRRTGVEEVSFINVYKNFESLCSLDGHETTNITQTLDICTRLGDYRLLICEYSDNDIHQRILLNVSKDDIHYAFTKT